MGLEIIKRREPDERIIPEVIQEPPELNRKPPGEVLKLVRGEPVEPIKPKISENPAERIQDKETVNQIKNHQEEDGQEPKMKKVWYFFLKYLTINQAGFAHTSYTIKISQKVYKTYYHSELATRFCTPVSEL